MKEPAEILFKSSLEVIENAGTVVRCRVLSRERILTSFESCTEACACHVVVVRCEEENMARWKGGNDKKAVT